MAELLLKCRSWSVQMTEKTVFQEKNGSGRFKRNIHSRSGLDSGFFGKNRAEAPADEDSCGTDEDRCDEDDRMERIKFLYVQNMKVEKFHQKRADRHGKEARQKRRRRSSQRIVRNEDLRDSSGNDGHSAPHENVIENRLHCVCERDQGLNVPVHRQALLSSSPGSFHTGPQT